LNHELVDAKVGDDAVGALVVGSPFPIGISNNSHLWVPQVPCNAAAPQA
jgi:hypothetical protein